MLLEERLQALGQLGSLLVSQGGVPESIVNKAKAHNPWFTEENVQKATLEVANAYLNNNELSKWLSDYSLNQDEASLKIGLLLAGNIPLVGFHDMLCTFVSGHLSLIKASDRDKVLLDYLLSELVNIDSDCSKYFEFVTRLSNYDAVIATGSDSSGRYFKKYFGKVPHIIRMNRNGISVIYNDTPDEALVELGKDLFGYFGLGCRNVSKLYLEDGFDIQRIFKAIERHRDIIHHNKYKNNYDYNFAMYLLNKEDFLTNDFIVLRKDKAIASRIAALHYSYFDSYETLNSELGENKDKIQCIISDRPIDNFKVFDFGKAQQPSLTDYSDGIDTLEFLLNLK